MGYCPQIWFEKDKEIDFIAEAHNDIPLFWSLIFSNSQYTITVEEDSLILKIEPGNLVIPNIHFDGDILNCWQDFHEMLKGKLAKGYHIVLDLSGILLMDEDEKNLKTFVDINSACQKFFNNTLQGFEQFNPSLTYTYLLGFCDRSEVNPEKYNSLYSKNTHENLSKAKIKKQPSFWGAVFLILQESVIVLLGIGLCLSSLYLIIVESRWIIGILGILLFGLGTFIYTMIACEKIRGCITKLKKLS